MIIFLILMNLFGFAVAGYDKYAAIHKKRRISEKGLFMWAVWFGGIGVILAFLIFRHKTKHHALFFRIAFITVIEYLIVIYCIFNPEIINLLFQKKT